MQCNGMGHAWVTEDGSHKCSVTEWGTPGLPRMGYHECSVMEWGTPGLPRMGYHECSVTEWVNHGLPRMSFVYKIKKLYKDH